jgi:hypothetical protein
MEASVSIKVKIKDTLHELSLEEAKALRDVLDHAIGLKPPSIPYPYPFDRQPWVPDNPLVPRSPNFPLGPIITWTAQVGYTTLERPKQRFW